MNTLIPAQPVWVNGQRASWMGTLVSYGRGKHVARVNVGGKVVTVPVSALTPRTVTS